MEAHSFADLPGFQGQNQARRKGKLLLFFSIMGTFFLSFVMFSILGIGPK